MVDRVRNNDSAEQICHDTVIDRIYPNQLICHAEHTRPAERALIFAVVPAFDARQR